MVHSHTSAPQTPAKPSKPSKPPLDYVVYIFGIVTPLFELPQALTIFMHHSAHNVSIFTWGFFLIDNFVWIIYAYARQLWPLLITSVLYEIVECLVVVGILLYS